MRHPTSSRPNNIIATTEKYELDDENESGAEVTSDSSRTENESNLENEAEVTLDSSRTENESNWENEAEVTRNSIQRVWSQGMMHQAFRISTQRWRFWPPTGFSLLVLCGVLSVLITLFIAAVACLILLIGMSVKHPEKQSTSPTFGRNSLFTTRLPIETKRTTFQKNFLNFIS